MSRSRSRFYEYLFLIVYLAAVAILLGLATRSDDEDDRFVAAKQECAERDEYVTVLDDGAGLSVQTLGNETDGTTLETTHCVLAALEAPESVVVRLDQTRALDGMQTAEWDGITASWTYHPDAGLGLVLAAAQ